MAIWGAIGSFLKDNLGGIISSGLSSGLGLAGSKINNEEAFEQSMALQAQAQAWQERMSNTAHQREVADLRKAGLNPLLSAMNGTGASTGSVGTGSVSRESYGEKLQQFAMNAAQIRLMKEQALTEHQQQDAVRANTELTLANKMKVLSDKILNDKTAEWFDKRQAKELDYISSQIALNQGVINLNKTQEALNNLQIQWNPKVWSSQIGLNSSQSVLNYATAKFQNERARGFTETVSNSETKGQTESRNIGLGKYGQSSHKDHTKSRSYSKTW